MRKDCYDYLEMLNVCARCHGHLPLKIRIWGDRGTSRASNYFDVKGTPQCAYSFLSLPVVSQINDLHTDLGARDASGSEHIGRLEALFDNSSFQDIQMS